MEEVKEEITTFSGQEPRQMNKKGEVTGGQHATVISNDLFETQKGAGGLKTPTPGLTERKVGKVTKLEDGTLKLPSADYYEDFVNFMKNDKGKIIKESIPNPSSGGFFDPVYERPDGKIATVKTTFTPEKIRSGFTIDEVEDGGIEWVGELDWPAFIGYPFTGMNKTVDADGKVVKREPFLLPLGLPLMVLYFDAATHCYVVVRSDVYVH